MLGLGLWGDLLGVSGGVTPLPLDPSSDSGLGEISEKPSFLKQLCSSLMWPEVMELGAYACPSLLVSLGRNLDLLFFRSRLGTLGGSPSRLSPKTKGLEEHISSEWHFMVDELLWQEKVKSAPFGFGWLNWNPGFWVPLDGLQWRWLKCYNSSEQDFDLAHKWDYLRYLCIVQFAYIVQVKNVVGPHSQRPGLTLHIEAVLFACRFIQQYPATWNMRP